MTAAVDWVRERLPEQPSMGLILGSGLGELADLAEDATRINTADIPGYPAGTVQGHSGRLVAGTLHGKAVLFVQGRLHLYEGHSMHNVTFPVRLLAGLGVSDVVVTNAAGGINPDFPPGTLMWIRDHINWAFENPLESVEGAERSRPSASPYDDVWMAAARRTAHRLGVQTQSGTYLWTRGPNYETPAEIRAYRNMGADAVGMSTVPEVLVAHRLGMSVLGLSTITNPAAGMNAAPLNHEEVLETGRRVRKDLERLILGLIADRV